MEALGIALAIGGVIALVAFIIYVAWRIEKKRTEALGALAQQLGFSFEAVPPGLADEHSAFQLFQQGHSRKGKNFMRGEFGGVAVAIFDYQYTTGHGKNQTTWKHTVVRVDSDKLQLPSFICKPEHIFHKLGSVFGYQDIDIEERPVFSKKYLLRGKDEDAIRKVFTRPVCDQFEANLGTNVEGLGSRLLFYNARRCKPENLKTYIGEGLSFFKVLAQA